MTYHSVINWNSICFCSHLTDDRESHENVFCNVIRRPLRKMYTLALYTLTDKHIHENVLFSRNFKIRLKLRLKKLIVIVKTSHYNLF